MNKEKDLSAVFICKNCTTIYSMQTGGFSHDSCLFCNDENLYYQIIPHGMMFNSPSCLIFQARNQETNEKVIVFKWKLKEEEKQFIYNLYNEKSINVFEDKNKKWWKMSIRKSNKVVHIPKCILCPRDNPSFHGECFIAIPSNVNENGKWIVN